MRPKTLFDGRPRLDAAVRVLALAGFLALLASAVVTADARVGALAIGLGAFAVRETYELDAARDRLAQVLFWACLAVWLLLALI